MKNYYLVLSVLILALPVGAQEEIDACEREQQLIEEAEQKIQESDSQEEREVIEDRYTPKINEAAEKCREEKEVTGGARYYNTTQFDRETCEKKSERLRERFIRRFENSSFQETEALTKDYIAEHSFLESECEIYGGEPETRRLRAPKLKSELPNLTYTLPKNTAPKCRNKVKEERQEYLDRIDENRRNASELASSFYDEVEEIIGECEGVPRIPNVTEAPEGITEGCKDRIRKLNSEVERETGARPGQKVPEGYRQRYKDAFKACIAETAKQRVTDRIKDRIGIESRSGDTANKESETQGESRELRDIIKRKNSRIEQLQDRIEELRRRLEQLGEDPEKKINTSVQPRTRESDSGNSGETGGNPEPSLNQNEGSGRSKGIISRIVGILP